MKENPDFITSKLNISEYVAVLLAGQLFGIPVEKVHEILNPQKITKVPLSPPRVGGVLNLRGRIVTVINLYAQFSFLNPTIERKHVNLVVENHGELYSLIVDHVLDVIQLKSDQIESNSENLEHFWHNISTGIVRYDGQLMILLNIEALLSVKKESIKIDSTLI